MKWKIIKYFSIFVLIVSIGTGIGVLAILNKHYKELPNITEMIENYSPSIPTTIYDRNGKLIDVISKESRELIDIKNIPKILSNGFIAIEDSEFYNHYGINPIRLVGAMVANVKNKRFSQGGSTITQQLVKNSFLTSERKFSRKIKELLISFEIERKYTKDEIMEKYLNEIYFGSGAYGVQAASNTFFRKDVTDINLAEAALLVGIPNRPSFYSPRTKLKNAIKRKNLVLSQMVRFRLISEEEKNKAVAHKFINEGKASPEDFNDENTTIIYNAKKEVKELAIPDFTDLIKKFLFDNFDENQIYNDGLVVETTVDLNLQKIAKKTFDEYVVFKKNEELQGGMVTIDAQNGAILAIVGGKDYKAGNFNRATQAKRQFGSAFKPFIYYTAIENGFEENSVIEDARIYRNGWTPKNSSNLYYHGMTVLDAFDKSQNIVSIKLLESAGVDKLMENLKKLDLGINYPETLSIALGAVDGTPLQLAQGYAPFANGGYSVQTHAINKITDKYGNITFQNQLQIEKQFDSLSAALVTNMMKSSVKNGTSGPARVVINGQPIEQGGKTGTTNNARSVWYTGITPEYVTAIYIGYDDNKPLKGAFGGKTVAPLWKNFYTEIIEEGYYTPTKFTYIDNHVKSKEIFYQNLDPKTSLLTDAGLGKTYLVRAGNLSSERDVTYKNGIAGALGYVTEDNVMVDPNLINENGILIEPVNPNNSLDKIKTKENVSPYEKYNKDVEDRKKKGLLQRLFKF